MDESCIKYKLIFNCCDENLTVLLDKKEFELLRSTNSKFIELPIKDNKIIIKKSFFSQQVPNKVRFKLSFIKSKWHLTKPNGEPLQAFSANEFDLDLETSSNNIFLILESPHKDEYDSNMNPHSPAMKSTGNFMYLYFISKILPRLYKNGLVLDTKKTYNMCLINPVPYQTSLYYITEKKINPELRDKIWEKIFFVTEKQFINDIKKFTPSILINCCTGNMKKNVQRTLNTLNLKAQIQITDHPSRWIFLKLPPTNT